MNEEYQEIQPEPTDQQIEQSDPNYEVNEHQRRIRETNAMIRAQGRIPTLRDTYDPRFDGPW